MNTSKLRILPYLIACASSLWVSSSSSYSSYIPLVAIFTLSTRFKLIRFIYNLFLWSYYIRGLSRRLTLALIATAICWIEFIADDYAVSSVAIGYLFFLAPRAYLLASIEWFIGSASYTHCSRMAWRLSLLAWDCIVSIKPCSGSELWADWCTAACFHA